MAVARHLNYYSSRKSGSRIITINKETYAQLIFDCVMEFKKLHPEYQADQLSPHYIITRLINYYLRGDVMNDKNAHSKF